MVFSRIFFYSCLSFIFGILLASFFVPSLIIRAVLFLTAFLFLISVFFKSDKALITGFCLLFLLIGAWRYQTAKNQLERPDLQVFSEKKVIIEGMISEEPELRQGRQRVEVLISSLQAKILVTTELYPQLRYGDQLWLEGVLKEPPVFEGFNYKDYLKNKGIFGLMSYPEIEILQRGSGSPLKAIPLFLKDKLKQSLAKILPFYQLGLFEALLFGDEDNISVEWKEKLNISGTRHIAAVSGMNITILSSILLSFLLFLGLWRQQALWLSLALIAFYILMIGAPACGVRAGIMGALFLISQYFGRLVQPERLIVSALTFMLLLNPLLLRSDVGFQLSFLAVVGLIYLGPLFSGWLKKVPDFLELRLSLCSTLAAQVFTLPILLYNFGQISLVSPLTNILILPTIPLLTILGFVVSLVGIFWQGLAWFLSLPGQIILMLNMKIIDWFSQLSIAAKQIQVSGLFVFVSYILLAILVFYLKKKQKLAFLNY